METNKYKWIEAEIDTHLVVLDEYLRRAYNKGTLAEKIEIRTLQQNILKMFKIYQNHIIDTIPF